MSTSEPKRAIASSSTASSAASASASAAAAAAPSRLPLDLTMQHAARLAVAEDKPIMMDYWIDSLRGKAIIGVRESTGEKLLIKSEEEYTSPVAKFYKSGTEYIVITENSIYIVSGDLPSRKIAWNTLSCLSFGWISRMDCTTFVSVKK